MSVQTTEETNSKPEQLLMDETEVESNNEYLADNSSNTHEVKPVSKSNTLLEKLSNYFSAENKHKYPLYIVKTATIISVLFFIHAVIKILIHFIAEWNQIDINIIFFKSTTYWSIVAAFLISIFAGFTFLLSTRVQAFQSEKARVSLFVLTIGVIFSQITLWGIGAIIEYLVPFITATPQKSFEIDGVKFSLEELSNPWESAIPFAVNEFMVTIMFFPIILLILYGMKIREKYLEHGDRLKEAFFTFEWKGKWQQSFSRLENTKEEDYFPDVELGRNHKGEMVIMPGQDRALHSMIVGSVGTGKTAALAQPMLNQDLDHIAKYINDRPNLSKREDFFSEEVEGRYLNGISVIDPSNDLCQNLLKLVKVHKIPLEAVTYINPQDPHTPSINPMRGPVDKVAETFAEVMAGLSDSGEGNVFFEQAQRNHLKQYIYLLKLHDKDIEIDRKEATFDMLIDMYNNPQVAHEKHVLMQQRLKTELGVSTLSSADISNRIEDLGKPAEVLREKLLTNKDLTEEEILRTKDLIGQIQDAQNYWKIFQGVDEWFRMNLVKSFTKPVKDANGNVISPAVEEWQDAKAQHVEGLRNQLNDISSNILIRRVLFGKSDFDFDRHLAMGGVLLLNTAKGQLGKLSQVLGKIVLMNLQNASFRRPVKISPYHHILVDEFPDFVYKSFQEFPAQIRKYKVIVTTLQQTLAQMKGAFGEDFLNTLVSTMRHRMVYADVTGYDAKYFSDIFGEVQRIEEGLSEGNVSALQDDPSSRTSASYTTTKEAKMSAGDILFQDKFECAVKLVINNQTQPVQQIQANFIPKPLWTKAKVEVEPEAGNDWLAERRLFLENWLAEKEAQIQNEQENLAMLQQLEEEERKKNENAEPPADNNESDTPSDILDKKEQPKDTDEYVPNGDTGEKEKDDSYDDGNALNLEPIDTSYEDIMGEHEEDSDNEDSDNREDSNELKFMDIISGGTVIDTPEQK